MKPNQSVSETLPVDTEEGRLTAVHGLPRSGLCLLDGTRGPGGPGQDRLSPPRGCHPTWMPSYPGRAHAPPENSQTSKC